MTPVEGLTAELAAEGAWQDAKLIWEVGGGDVVSAGQRRARWKLSAQPGLYQVQLVADRGASGLSFDALVVEVT